SKYDKWMSVYLHFKNFTGGQCTFGDVTVSLCEDFRDYLLIAHSLRHPEKKIPLSANSAAEYLSTFRCLLKMTYKEELLLENVNDFLDGLKWQEVKKEYKTFLWMRLTTFQSMEPPPRKCGSPGVKLS
ncbi:MAG: phage integrase SAM-like domain-containing protein, partial [Muribaculum sp.]|nr:phage integrase SAM-like domain-containing protein [Muribaculum sp.]